ncbi:MAG TPA: DUF4389 domain-containing protein [Kofleriaceae bacterium]
MRDYPVHVDVISPPRFERIQVLLRIVLAIALAGIGITGGWLVCLLYFALPIFAAVAVSAVGGDLYRTKLWRVLAWGLKFSGFMLMIVDRFPSGDDDDDNIAIDIQLTGKPTVASALGRLVMSLPSGVVLVVLWFVSSILWLVGAAVVLVAGWMPQPILGYQRAILRWQARLVAYHASLVAEYPPFSLDTGAVDDHPLTAVRV